MSPTKLQSNLKALSCGNRSWWHLCSGRPDWWKAPKQQKDKLRQSLFWQTNRSESQRNLTFFKLWQNSIKEIVTWDTTVLHTEQYLESIGSDKRRYCRQVTHASFSRGRSRASCWGETETHTIHDYSDMVLSDASAAFREFHNHGLSLKRFSSLHLQLETGV